MSLKVAVLVPTFNRPLLLRQALASLSTQALHRDDFEVVIVNDGGSDRPDRTWPGGLRARWLDVKHGGQSAALNAALAASTAPYVTVAHDDDLVLPTKLSSLADALDRTPPGVVASYGLPIHTDEIGRPMGCPAQLVRFLDAHPRLAWADIARGDGLWVHGTAIMYRRAALVAIGGWDANLPTSEEYDLHLRLLHAGGVFAAVKEHVVTYRPGGKSGYYRARNRRTSTMRRIYKKLGWTGPPKSMARV